MKDDIVAAGSDRPPLPTPWLVAGGVVLVVFAAAGTLRATDHLHLPRAAASPSPTVSVPPLETIPPVLPALGSLVPDPRALKAEPYGPGEGISVVVTTELGIISIATVDDMQTTVSPTVYNETPAGVVETKRGPVWVVRPWDFNEHTDSTLYLPGHDEGIVLHDAEWIFPAARDDEFWTIGYDSADAQRVDLDGHAIGPQVRLRWNAGLLRGTEAGLLVAASDGLRIWDPLRGRYVRTITTEGSSLAATSRYVVWVGRCRSDSTCPVHLTDVTTGRDWPVPLPEGPGTVSVAIDPSGQYLAYTFDSEQTPDTTVWFWQRGDPKPRQIVTDADDLPVHLAWTSPDRLALVQSIDEQTVVYGWDRRTGALRLGGAYIAGTVETIVAAH